MSTYVTKPKKDSGVFDMYEDAPNRGSLNKGDITADSLGSLWANQLLVVNYIWAEMRRRKRPFIIGVFTVFLVVMVLSLLLNSVLKSPIIFLKLSENAVGENDLVLTPGYSVSGSVVEVGNIAGLPLVNHTNVNITVQHAESASGTTPRWLLLADVTPTATATEAVTAYVLAINSLQEKFIGLGREWQFPPLDAQECIISRTILRQLNINPDTSIGRAVNLQLSLIDIANTLDIISLDKNRELSPEEARRLVEFIFPGLSDIANDTVSINVTNIVTSNFNTTQLTDTIRDTLNITSFDIGAINATAVNQLVNDIVNGLFNTSFNLGLNTSTGTIELPNTLLGNLTADLSEILVAIINNQTIPQVTLNVTVGDLIDAALPQLLQQLQLNLPLTVRGVVDSPDGKWPAAIGSVVVVEGTKFLSDLRNQFLTILRTSANITQFRIGVGNLVGFDLSVGTLLSGLPADTRQQVESVLNGETTIGNNSTLQRAVQDLDFESFSLTSIVQYRDRLDAYLKDLKAMHIDIIRFTNDVAENMGFRTPNTFTTPLDVSLQQTIFLRYFLDNIFASVTVLVAILGVLLIYSLLLNDVEEKTYEYGMLRALGMKQRTLIQLLTTKSLTFAIPGIGLGLFFTFIFNIPVAQQIADFAVISPDYTLKAAAIWLGFAIGFAMPLVANIVPISRALSRTLRDSLDVYHQVISDITVRVIRLSQLGLDVWQTALAILLIVVGFITYYLIPYSFTFRNFALFLGLLNAILLGMLLGLCILAQMIQPYLERLMLHLIICGDHRRLKNVVRKNLSGHGSRNKKTAQMFTICLAFVIFAGVMFALQASNISDNIKQFFGTDLVIMAPNMDESLNEQDMTNFLNNEMQRRQRGETGAVVEAFTFVTFPLDRNPSIRRVRISNLPNFPSVRNFIFGVQKNYLDVAFPDYYLVSETASGVSFPRTRGGKPDVVAVMYTDLGNARLPEETGATVRVPTSFASGQRFPLKVNMTTQTNITTTTTTTTTSLADEYTTTQRNEAMNKSYIDYVDVVISEALRPFAAVTTKTPLDLTVTQRIPDTTITNDQHYLGKARAMMSQMSGFFFSSYQPTVFLSSVLIREEQYARILNDANRFAGLNTTGAPKMRCMIRVSSGASRKDREDVLNGLRTYFKSDRTQALDIRQITDTAKSAVDLLSLFTTVVGLISMILCFFILWLSFNANVRENAWEFGVLRALGLNSVQVVMVYVYEALALVLSSLSLGLIIGLAIAVSLTLQFNLFTEYPFRFNFPHTLFWSMTGMAVAVAVIGSILPSYSFLRKSISNVIRRQ